MDKNELRKIALENRKTQNTNLVSKEVVKYIINNRIINDYNNIGIYYPLKHEIDIKVLKEIYPDKQFYIPRIKNDLIEFAKFDEELTKGPFNTREPVGNMIDISLLDCIIIPCVAISNGRRIGYGKGYYDKSLKNYNGYKIGICYRNCIFNYDLCEYDLKLDSIISGGNADD